MREGVHVLRWTVDDSSIDGNGHINNVAYIQRMQDVAIAHATATGSTAETTASGSSWVVRSHQVEYLRPGYAGEEVDIFTWVTDFKKVSSTRRYLFRRVGDGEVLVRGETLWVFVDVATGRPRAIPEAVAACFVCLPSAFDPLAA